MQLFANLLNHCPVDTRNMVTHIELYESQDAYEIVVAAPYATHKKYKEKGITSAKARVKEGKKTTIVTVHNYAGTVNYALKSPHYHWVEREIQNTMDVVNGTNVEGGNF